MIRATKKIAMEELGFKQIQLLSLEKLGICDTYQLAAFLNTINEDEPNYEVFQMRLVSDGNSKMNNARTIITVVKTLFAVELLTNKIALKYYYYTASYWDDNICAVMNKYGTYATDKNYFNLAVVIKNIAESCNVQSKNICINSFFEIDKEAYDEFQKA